MPSYTLCPAIRIGGTTFRLILAVRAGSGNLESIFQRTLDTVRQVTPEEARSIRPLRLAVVTAREGDTVESLASRMVVNDNPVERCELLNGLDPGTPVRPGEAYKIVVE